MRIIAGRLFSEEDQAKAPGKTHLDVEQVFLDGEPIQTVKALDTKEGWIEQYTGEWKDGHPKLEKRYGNVTFTWRGELADPAAEGNSDGEVSAVEFFSQENVHFREIDLPGGPASGASEIADAIRRHDDDAGTGDAPVSAPWDGGDDDES